MVITLLLFHAAAQSQPSVFHYLVSAYEEEPEPLGDITYDGYSSLTPVSGHTRSDQSRNITDNGQIIGWVDPNDPTCASGCTNPVDEGDGNTGGTGSIRGYKVVMPNNQNIEPARSARIALGSQNTTANPYSFTNVSSNGTKTVWAPNIAGYMVGYSICWNRTNCHSLGEPGFVIYESNSASFDVPNNGYVDLWWHYIPTGTIQGQKVLENQQMGEPASSQRVTLVKGNLQPNCTPNPSSAKNSTCNPFYFLNAASLRTVKTTIPAGYRAWYTACYNRTTNCHNPDGGDTPDVVGNCPARDSTCETVVSVPMVGTDGVAGHGYVDFRWHFFAPPKGVLDSATCTNFSGWACDPTNFAVPLAIHFWKYDAAGTPTWVGSTIANQTREAAVAAQCGGNANHGFTFNTPTSVKTGQPYTIHAYAINEPNQPLNGTYYNIDIGSQNVTCTAPSGAISCAPDTLYIPAGQTASSTIASTYQNFVNGYPSADVCVSSTANPTPGPAGWWKFNETSGTTAADSSGNALNGTLNGGASWTGGKIAGGLALTNNQYAEIANSATSLHSDRQISIAGWFKLSNLTPEWQRVFFKGNPDCGTNCDNREYSLWVRNDGLLHLASTPADRIGTGQTVCNSTAGTIQANQWYHFAAVLNSDANSMKSYINGAEVAGCSYSTSNIRTTNGNFQIGDVVNGTVDDFRIYKRALSAGEITALYGGGTPSLFAGGGGPNGSTNDTASFIAPGNTYNFDLFSLSDNTSARCSGTTIASCTVTGLPKPYSVSGNIFVDTDKNLTKGGSEANYTAGSSTIQVRSGVNCSGALVADVGAGGTLTTANGAFTTGLALLAGTYSFCYTSLPQGYIMTYSPGTPPFFSVTVGEPPACSVGSHNTAGCDGSGSITNLNFGISNSIPWWQCVGGDCGVGGDPGGGGSGIVNPIPTSPSLACSGGPYASVTGPSSNTPGVIFSGGLSSPDFGQGQASSPQNWVCGGVSYPYSYTSLRRTSYDYLMGIVKKSGLTATALAGACNNSSGCALTGLAHGLYQSDGDVYLNASTVSVNNNYVILIKGNLYINGNITIPIGSTATFSVSGNIIVDKAVTNIQGFYSADNSFSSGGNNGDCTVSADAALNIYGAVVTGAAGGGGTFQNQRDLCANNLSCPSYTISERPDFFLNAPELIKIPSFVWQEVAP